jgi:hypothetical protein
MILLTYFPEFYLFYFRCNANYEQVRVRSILIDVYGSGSTCNSTIDTSACSMNFDCVQTQWTSWSACTAMCGTGGLQYRTRETITPASSFGVPCGPLSETIPCPVAAQLCGPGLVCYPVETANGTLPTCIDLPASNPEHVCQAVKPCGFQQCFDVPAPNSGHYCFCDPNYGYVYGLASPWGGLGCMDANACIDFPCSNYSLGCADLPAPYYINNAAGRSCGACFQGYTGDGSLCQSLFGRYINIYVYYSILKSYRY